MSTIKRLSGDYYVKTLQSGSSITLESSTINLLGNLNVFGNASYTSVANAAVYDNYITLNEGFPQTSDPNFDAGIIINRGSFSNVALRWSELNQRWQITDDGVTYRNILASTTGTSALEAVEDDGAPALGGNLNVKNFSIGSTIGAPVRINSSNVAITISDNPAPTVSGTISFNAQLPGGGGSGLYVTNTDSINTELITKTKAIVYSLIF
jgi:hypothetical protein